MGDYNRSTRECSFGQLKPELLHAIRNYLQDHEMENVEAEILMCCETTSQKKKKGLFAGFLGSDPDPVHYTGMLVTPEWLVWARHGVKYGTVVLSARLKEVEVKEFSSPLLEDTGLEVFGFVDGSSEKVNAFIGLGSELAARRFREVVEEAAAKAG
jgi:hypothetical protein